MTRITFTAPSAKASKRLSDWLKSGTPGVTDVKRETVTTEEGKGKNKKRVDTLKVHCTAIEVNDGQLLAALKAMGATDIETVAIKE